MKKVITLIVMLSVMMLLLTSCADANYTYNSSDDRQATKEIASTLAERQPTPTDIQYSLERYNLIRRAYWVNGMREKARALPCPVADVPMGYVILLTESGAVVGHFEVDGKVTSLNSYLTPDSDYYSIENGSNYTKYNNWLSDVDGSYGENDNGIFFFTPDGNYIEWTGIYLYSDIPFLIKDPVVTYDLEAQK